MIDDQPGPCRACIEAETNPLTGNFGLNCTACGARALANSPEYHASTVACAMTPAYAAALLRVFGPDRMVREAGHRSVREWDKVISAARAARACAHNPPFSGVKS